MSRARPHPHRFRRTAIAACLVLIAVLLPSSLWLITGEREAGRRAARLVTEAEAAIQRTVSAETERLSSRLEALRAAETARPFYQYQNLYHDPRGATDGLAVVPSPLASGAVDPLIWSHFQIDPSGRISLPAVNEQFPELSTEQGLAVYCSFLEALRGAVVVPVEPGNPGAAAPVPGGRGEVDGTRVVVFDQQEWQQHRRADDLYARITGRDPTIATGLPAFAGQAGSSALVSVREGPLVWRTIIIDQGPLLAAVREVETPDGTLIQGFALSVEAVADWLGTSRLEPGPGPAVGPHLVAAPIGRTGWWLTADAARAIAEARARGRSEVRDFRRRFALVAAAAFVAGLALVLLVAQADRLAAQRARFAAAAAHELKTPLSSLRLFSEMLADNLGDPTRTGAYARRIAAEVTRLGRVVANMLDLARLERGADLVELRPGNVAQVVQECVEQLRPGLESSGLRLELQLESRSLPAYFDPDALCQIMHNLLDNADKHTRGHDARVVRLSLSVEDERPVLRVADTGDGIPRRLADRIFEPFERGGKAAATSGLGLGLPLSRALARAQGGELELEPADGGGACFKLVIGPPPG